MDLFNFPDLTTDVLGAAFTFLLGRLGKVLDHHGEPDDTEASTESSIDVDPEGVLAGTWNAGEPDAATVEVELPHLHQLAGALGSYERHPERIVPQDQALRANLDELRTVLEKVYEQRITFRGEDRPPTGTSVMQDFDSISGEVVGIDAGRVRDGSVVQRGKEVRAGGSVIGVRSDEVGS